MKFIAFFAFLVISTVSFAQPPNSATWSFEKQWSSGGGGRPINKRPNVIVIMSDDLGWSDVSMHGSELPTPNIDSLGFNGIRFDKFYTPPMCTPSRSSLMTGKYPIRTGLHQFVIDADNPFGLGLEQKIFPQFFKESGYATHMVGKWHLGFFKRPYAPLARGFDTFNGYLGPYIDYWDHSFIKPFDRNYSRGLDMRHNWETNWGTNGTYATNLFTKFATDVINSADERPFYLQVNHLAPHTANEDDPMQAPQDEIDKFKHIKDPKRRTLAAMVKLLDNSVGEIISALDRKGILGNTIIVFYSDNGAPTLGLHSTQGSNFPFKGQKNSGWEGAVRVPAVMWAPNLPRQRVRRDLFHLADLLPTLATAANVNLGPFRTGMDGIDQWWHLRADFRGPRTNLLYNIDPVFGYSAYVENDWKLLNGSTVDGKFDAHLGNFIDPQNLINDANYYQLLKNSPANLALQKYGPPMTPNRVAQWRKNNLVNCRRSSGTPCNPFAGPCLFNLKDDPCEYNNVAATYPTIVNKLWEKVEYYASLMYEPRNRPVDPACDPRNWNYTWTYWQDPQPL